jgi:hypothetical protein
MVAEMFLFISESRLAVDASFSNHGTGVRLRPFDKWLPACSGSEDSDSLRIALTVHDWIAVAGR